MKPDRKFRDLFFWIQWGPYVWKTYEDVYNEVLHVGAALRASGIEPVRNYLSNFLLFTHSY